MIETLILVIGGYLLIRYFCLSILCFELTNDMAASLIPLYNFIAIGDNLNISRWVSVILMFLGTSGLVIVYYALIASKLKINPFWSIVFYAIPIVGFWPYYLAIKRQKNGNSAFIGAV